VKAAALLFVALVGIVAPAGFVSAQTASGQPWVAPGTADSLLTQPQDQERYKRLAQELRCLVCQNQTLADSDASLAHDLRRQLESMIVDGRNDEEIKRFLVDRYGDFVLYRPPIRSSTWILWFGPFLLLAIGAAVWFTLHRRRKPADGRPAPGNQPGHTDPGEAAGSTTSADIERVRKLLDAG
jgi:cytochrome c-type biogenesis protein CcmH